MITIRVKGDNQVKYEINKERLWIFSPVAAVTTKVIIEGEASVDDIKEAIHEAVNCNEVLKTKVVLEGEKANLVPIESACYEVEVNSEDWRKILHDQEKLPFDLTRGEYLRFFIIRTNQGQSLSSTSTSSPTWTLLLIGHHLAGDGISHAFLIQDIMKALNHEELIKKPIELFHMEDLPPKSELNGLMKVMLNSFNRQWKKNGKQFTFEELTAMSQKYWEKHSSCVQTCKLSGNSYQAILRTAKENKVTVNTIITTAFIKAAAECGEKQVQDVGHAVSIRNQGYEGMGNFATGISIRRQYDNKKSFVQNCVQVQKLLYNKLEDEKKKYFVLQFMGKITGSLVDAIYFSAVDGYENKTAKIFSRMFGYDGNAKGISITNLTRLSICDSFGSHKLRDYVFMPPLVLNARRIIGVASLRDSMEISFTVEDNKEKDEQLRYFDTAVSLLKNIEELNSKTR